MISIIAPFYNEASCVSRFFARLIPTMRSLGEPFEILCINDGSHDATLAHLIEIQRHNQEVKVIDLSRNFGKEAALTAGMDAACGEAVIPIDTDLQDPPELIPQLLEKWREGYEVVVAKRTDRSADSLAKRASAHWFYYLYNRIADCAIPVNAGDFRLMDRTVAEAIKRLPERNRFMKGLFAWVGFKTAVVEYVREGRIEGASKFNGWKLWNFALEGITSFSTAPLRIWTYLGLTVSMLALIYASFIVIRTLVYGIDVPGYASLLTAVLFLGGIQLIGIGIIGEYIGRIYLETKHRPVYVIRKIHEASE